MTHPEGYPLPKSEWGPGPWQDEPDEMAWEYRGVACRILRVDHSGALCGYVRVPDGHPWQNKDARDLGDIEVHCGITYAEREPDGWWIGFDCAHAYDYSPALAAYLRGLKVGATPFDGQPYRDILFVKGEVEGMADQLLAGAQ